jgi:drug/metabolite transporter (DMT)-like permease
MEEGIGLTKYITYTAALMNAVIVGLSFLFTKVALEATSPIETLGYRFLIGWIALTIFMKFTGQSSKLSLKGRSKKQVGSLLVLALFYPTLFFSFQALGLTSSSSAEGGIIIAFSPAVTALLAAIFIKEKVNVVQSLFIFLSIFGVVFVFVMNGVAVQLSANHLVGIILLILSTISLSAYAVLTRFLSDSFTPIQLTYIMVTFGFVFFNLSAISVKIMEGRIADYVTNLTDLDFILSVLFLGIFATMLTAYLSNYILSKITASKMSVFSNLSTVISILAGALILNEEIRFHHILGSVLIIIGVLGTNFYKQKPAALTAKQKKTIQIRI